MAAGTHRTPGFCDLDGTCVSYVSGSASLSALSASIGASPAQPFTSAMMFLNVTSAAGIFPRAPCTCEAVAPLPVAQAWVRVDVVVSLILVGRTLFTMWPGCSVSGEMAAAGS
ncbi:hypothetical protein CGC20_17785 [Leishmania donovani]|uniref:Uncharacterized protein n=1 Tax=Leishmania donovani TaxID=5661 RepID=A0A504XYJ3_LEIDO|nr:hypothetical protein CGC21_16900 [Leishmania donovani]TPP51265.1 hypothetical protein CGC20_17785 [Leishmania donovani]